ncbi:MAG: NTP transferase domain-containing protein [Candidatus Aminicenantaceae bacterium]
MIWAIILAAGESKRMGKPKLLLPFGDKTIIETVVQIVIDSKVDETLVVLGSDWKEIEKKIRRFPLKISVNPDFQKGMLSSVKWGFKKIPEDTRAVLVTLGDQPSVSTNVINKVIETFNSTEKGIVLPVYDKNRGHPVLIDMKYRGEVEALSPDVGLRELVYSHSEDLLEVEVKTSSVLQDIDDKEDYESELLKRKK